MDDSELQALTRKKFSNETTKKVQWVRRMFNNWRSYRNSHANLENVECDIEDVGNLTQECLKVALCKFLTEVKCLDGEDFPARTMYDIMICMQFWLESNGLSRKLISDEAFADVKYTLDNIMKSRYEASVGQKVHKAEIITEEDEEILWALGILGTSNPQVLLNTLVYMIGLHCALQAGNEHRVLRSIPFDSQFEFVKECSGYVYVRFTEDVGMKTNKGGLKHRKMEPKVVEVYPNASNTDRCPVAILHKYLSLLPLNRVCKSLYLQPRKKFNSTVWFLDRPVGINTLRDTVKGIYNKAGFPGFYSNHSLLSTSATRMYRGGVKEQVIQEITGHRSLAVCSYKHTSQVQR